MQTHAISFSLESLKHHLKQLSLSVLIILFTVGCIVLEYLIPAAYLALFSSHFSGKSVSNLCFLILGTFVCFFLLPALLQRFIFKRTLQAIGLCLPRQHVKTSLYMAIALVILMPWIIFCSKIPAFQSVYALKALPISQFILFQLFFFPLYYFMEEFFFRGFLFLSLWQRIGWHGFWITEVIFMLAHIGKPFLEVLLCIPASIVLSYLTLKTSSFYPAAIVHWILGMTLSIGATFF